MRVIAALSGGVDSAVAAARAVDAGHEVVGVHLALARVSGRAGSRGCCSPDDARDARRVADVLGIPYYVWDLADAFEVAVIDDFVAEYSAGRTPNPCLRCNESIKFAAVLDRARALGFDAVCTGHYARIVDTPDGRELHRAYDAEKDQSYVLAVLEPDQLAGAMFPLGESRKPEVRAEATDRGLLVAEKPDSHDICFIPDGDTAGFLAGRLGARTAEVVDATSGAVVGVHESPYALTIGQRRGLHLDRPAPDGAPRYVVALEPARVVIGPETLLSVCRIEGCDPRWCGPVPADGAQVRVQIRAHGEDFPATVEVVGGRVIASLDEPARGVASGQAMAMYDGTRVVGSATIERSSA